MKIAHSLIDLIGNTPLLRLERYESANHLPAALLAKLECFNPLSSAKDRAAKYMIEDAEAKGLLKPGTVIVEPTSGNTGVGLSYIAAIKGYQVILTMPETMSLERRNLLSALGARLELTPGAQGMKGAIARAEELLRTLPSAWMPGQFDNPANAKAHYETTGPEIWRDTDGKVDVLVAGVGSGGTVTGAGRYLKEQNPAIEVVAVEPAESPVLSGGQAGPHKIQGIGAGFVPAVLDRSVVDRVIPVPGDDAFAASRALAQTEGLLVGISSGAALSAAASLAKEVAYQGRNIVVVLPDTGERYLSTGLFQKSE
ncbi:cysteine synthase A [uncultured Pseudoflavonifractor sp.]|uniref:cysteine synthase A n=1 Tax=uncultured Pseudoflavonifractor sp. TaxID=1221379 RepID=UPI0025EDBA5F|nr:cysteine synthase A [uncultured Pseudoflavonifractor sp.]